jgi:hypothetical protein
VSGTNGKSNGQSHAACAHGTDAPPPVIADLAASCIRFVKQSVGFTLDFEPETLPVLDHYVELARKAVHERKETAPLVAQAIGAYLGEVTRRKYGGFWRTEDDPRSFRVEFEPVYLVLRPIELASRALELPIEPTPADVSTKRKTEDDEDDDETIEEADEESSNENEKDAATDQDPEEDLRAALFEVDEDDRETIAERLAALPPVPATQFHSPSTHFEVVELIVETIRARRIAAGMAPDAHLEPDDYAS